MAWECKPGQRFTRARAGHGQCCDTVKTVPLFSVLVNVQLPSGAPHASSLSAKKACNRCGRAGRGWCRRRCGRQDRHATGQAVTGSCESRAAVIAVVDDLKQVAQDGIAERRDAKVVEHEQVDLGQLAEEGRAFMPNLIAQWEPKLKAKVAPHLQRMRTKRGSCNHLKMQKRHIRLNTKFVKKPNDLPEYGIVHEMAHLLEPTRDERFLAVIQQHYPSWREARAELNDLPLAAENWKT